jgi:uncharacterized membrane protein
MKAELLILRLVHIFGGTFWVGSMMFTSFFLIPVIGASPAVAAEVMTGLQKRRLFTLLPVAALITIASGLRLLSIVSAGFSGSYFGTPTGRAFAAAAAAATLAFLISILISRPGFLRIGRLGASLGAARDDAARQGIAAEMQSLRRRVSVANGTVVVLLLFAAAGMATARYL